MSKCYEILREKIKNGCTEKQAIELWGQMPDEYKSCIKQHIFIEHCTSDDHTTILWHDYEGWGANPREDQPSQFAAVRTTLSLEQIDIPIDIYCKPTEDRLPRPIAAQITKISPLECLKNGLCEYEFANEIRKEAMVPKTVTLAYNGISYDKEMTRFTFFRNLLPAYEHEHKDGNGVWDILMLGAFIRAMSPKGIVWPTNKEGKPSLRLEDLASANGIVQENSHNAVDDVKALIDWARLIKAAKPNIWEYAFKHKHKKALKALIKPKNQILFHCGMEFGLETMYLAPIMPIHFSNTESDTVICIDLRKDYEWMLDRKAEDLAKLLYMKREELEKIGEVRPPIVKVKLAKCPILIPSGAFKDKDTFSRINIDRDEMVKKAKLASENKALHTILFETCAINTHENKPVDVELSLYNGGFFSRSDNSKIANIHKNGFKYAKKQMTTWDDERIPQLINRILAKNYPESLSEKELKQWRKHCLDSISKNELNFENIAEVAKEEIEDKLLLQDFNEYIANLRNILTN